MKLLLENKVFACETACLGREDWNSKLKNPKSIVDSLFRVNYCSYGNSVVTLHQLYHCRSYTSFATS
jgi:hypothetical protein